MESIQVLSASTAGFLSWSKWAIIGLDRLLQELQGGPLHPRTTHTVILALLYRTLTHIHLYSHTSVHTHAPTHRHSKPTKVCQQPQGYVDKSKNINAKTEGAEPGEHYFAWPSYAPCRHLIRGCFCCITLSLLILFLWNRDKTITKEFQGANSTSLLHC